MKWPFLVLASFFVFSVHAQEGDWWFDVEVILFDRGVSLNELDEQFIELDQLQSTQTDWDLITPVLQPNVSWILQGLPTCITPPDWISISAEEAYPLPELPEMPVIPVTEPDTLMTLENEQLSDSDLTLQIQPESIQEDEFIEEESIVLLDPNLLWVETFAPEVMAEPFVAELPPITCFDDKALSIDTTSFPFIEQLPVVISGGSRDETWGPHTLNENDHTLYELSQRIRQERKLTRMLHLAWRQPVAFGADNAKTIRLFGGLNYALTFDAEGQQLQDLADESEDENTPLPAEEFAYALATPQSISTESILDRLKSHSLIEDRQELENIWQIDGAFKVYLQYVGQVPYLHIESDLQYRQPVPVEGSTMAEMRLVNIPFEQLRRVISTQLHYFDHPMFGMIVEIRRFKRP